MSTTGTITTNITDMSITRARKISAARKAHKSVTSIASISEDVSISPEAEELEIVMQETDIIMNDDGDVDMVLVEEIRLALSNGELIIDHHSLAQKMLTFERALDEALAGYPEPFPPSEKD